MVQCCPGLSLQGLIGSEPFQMETITVRSCLGTFLSARLFGSTGQKSAREEHLSGSQRDENVPRPIGDATVSTRNLFFPQNLLFYRFGEAHFGRNTAVSFIAKRLIASTQSKTRSASKETQTVLMHCLAGNVCQKSAPPSTNPTQSCRAFIRRCVVCSWWEAFSCDRFALFQLFQSGGNDANTDHSCLFGFSNYFIADKVCSEKSYFLLDRQKYVWKWMGLCVFSICWFNRGHYPFLSHPSHKPLDRCYCNSSK